MPTPQRKSNGEGVVERLSRRGEEALTKLMDEVGRNERVTDALGRASSAKGKLDDASRRALQQVGLAPADEVESLRKQVESLEKRLAKLEGAPSGKVTGKATAKRSETKKTSTAKRRTTKARAGAKAPSPPAGRALGGGPGRGST
jgi:polyhydroxyalkanoate synthesis regulator phasin